MKSIIIIIAIFLVTLTAKADWVTKNGLEQIQLPDSNFFFTKVNDSCTKMLLVSQKNLKLYIVDLESGKIDREQKIPYNFDICDYDFELESFVFYEYIYFGGSPMYSNKNIPESGKLLVLYKNDYSVEFSNYTKLLTQPICYKEIKSLYISNHNLTIIVNACYIDTSNKNRGYIKSYTYNNLDSNYLDSNKYYGDEVSFLQNGVFVKGIPSLLIKNNKKYELSYTKVANNIFHPNNRIIDFNNEYLCYSNSLNILKYLDVENNNIINITNNESSLSRNYYNIISYFKLIDNFSKSAFFSNDSSLYIFDAFLNKVIDTMYCPKGKLYLNSANENLYSVSRDRIYRVSIAKYKSQNDEIIVNRDFHLFDDSIRLTKPDIKYYKDYSWKIDSITYIDEKPIINLRKAGTYDVVFSFIENGIRKTITKKNAIKVVDSLRVKTEILSSYDFKVNTPIIFNSTTNYSSATFVWEYNHCKSTYNNNSMDTYNVGVLYYSNSLTDIFENIGKKYITLICGNEYQELKLNYIIDIKSNLYLKLNRYSGFSPFTFEIDAKFNSSQCIRMSNVAEDLSLSYGKIEIGYLNPISFINSLSKYKHTITKSGVYKIRTSCISKSNNLFVNEIHDSVITVYDPTDIQDFAERKYIYKQDAEGIYCQLEGEGEVTLYDNVGRLVRTYQIENERYIRKEDLERGVYFLSIQTNGTVYHEKVLVE